MQQSWARGSRDRMGESAAALALVDEDTGPTFVLEGRIVTMTRRGVIEGRLAVRGGRIAAIVAAGKALPAALRAAPVVQTQGTIYPGLIDLHNHYVYDIAPLWRVPRLYNDRSQWANVASKKAEVSLPVKLLGVERIGVSAAVAAPTMATPDATAPNASDNGRAATITS